MQRGKEKPGCKKNLQRFQVKWQKFPNVRVEECLLDVCEKAVVRKRRF
jgi:hypothetical protein